MLKVVVIASPHSGQNRRRPARLQRLKGVAERGGATFFAPLGLDALDATIEGLADNPPDIVCINGGDGTVHRTVTAMTTHLPTLPTLALLPGGTMDIAARSTGWLGRPDEALKRVLAGDLATTERSLLRVDERWSGFLFGNGLIARFLEVYEEGDPSMARAARILARGAGSALVNGPFAKRLTRRWQGSVTLDGERLDGDDWLAVAAGTVEQIGLGFRPFRLAQPGAMHAVALGCPVARFAPELPRVYRRQPLRDPANIEKPVREILLESDEPIGYMVDGDFHRGGRELSIRLGATVRFLIPPSDQA